MFLNQESLQRKIDFDSKYLPERAKKDIAERYSTMNLIHNRGYHLSEQQRKLYLANRPINPRYNMMNSGPPSIIGAIQGLQSNIQHGQIPKPVLDIAYSKYQALVDIVYQQVLQNKVSKSMTIIDMSSNEYASNLMQSTFVNQLDINLPELITNIVNDKIFLIFYVDPSNSNLLQQLNILSKNLINAKDKVMSKFFSFHQPKQLKSFQQSISDLAKQGKEFEEKKKDILHNIGIQGVDLQNRIRNLTDKLTKLNKPESINKIKFLIQRNKTKNAIAKILEQHIKKVNPFKWDENEILDIDENIFTEITDISEELPPDESNVELNKIVKFTDELESYIQGEEIVQQQKIRLVEEKPLKDLEYFIENVFTMLNLLDEGSYAELKDIVFNTNNLQKVTSDKFYAGMLNLAVKYFFESIFGEYRDTDEKSFIGDSKKISVDKIKRAKKNVRQMTELPSF